MAEVLGCLFHFSLRRKKFGPIRGSVDLTCEHHLTRSLLIYKLDPQGNINLHLATGPNYNFLIIVLANDVENTGELGIRKGNAVYLCTRRR
jgi:hypothetical protein